MAQAAGKRLAQISRMSHCFAGPEAGPGWRPPVFRTLWRVCTTATHWRAVCRRSAGAVSVAQTRVDEDPDLGYQVPLKQLGMKTTYQSEDQSSAAVEPGVYRGKDGLARIVHPAILVVEQVARWRKIRESEVAHP